MENKNNIFKKIIFGSDEPEELPESRFKQFFWVIKENYGKLFLFNVFTFIFAIPLVITFIIMSYGMSQTDDLSLIFRYYFFFGLLLIPSIVFFGIGLSGLFYSIRKMIWVEEINIKTYFLGIKNNYKRFILIFLGLGISLEINLIDVFYYTNLSILSPIINYLLIGLGITQFVVILMMSLYQMGLEVRYSTTIKQMIKNSFKLSVANLFKNIIFFTIGLIPFVSIVFIPGVIQIIIISIDLFIGIALFVLIISEYLCYVFDKEINNSLYPEYYLKGLKRN